MISHIIITPIRCIVFQCEIEQIEHFFIYNFIINFDSSFQYSYTSIRTKVFFIFKIVKRSPPRYGGIDLVIIMLCDDMLVAKHIGTST
jgi:hypothetical protein